MKYLKRIRNLLSLGALVLVLLSCSYGIRPEPAVRSMSIGIIDNRTREPRLADRLREALTRELSAHSVRVSDGSENEISGTIENLDVTPLAERGGTIVKFSVSIGAEFELRRGPDGKAVKIAAPLAYMVTFGSDVPLDSLYSMREEAVRRAIVDLAADIAAAVVVSR